MVSIKGFPILPVAVGIIPAGFLLKILPVRRKVGFCFPKNNAENADLCIEKWSKSQTINKFHRSVTQKIFSDEPNHSEIVRFVLQITFGLVESIAILWSTLRNPQIGSKRMEN